MIDLLNWARSTIIMFNCKMAVPPLINKQLIIIWIRITFYEWVPWCVIAIETMTWLTEWNVLLKIWRYVMQNDVMSCLQYIYSMYKWWMSKFRRWTDTELLPDVGSRPLKLQPYGTIQILLLVGRLLPSWPNKADLDVGPSVRPQKVIPTLMKFGV